MICRNTGSFNACLLYTSGNDGKIPVRLQIIGLEGHMQLGPSAVFCHILFRKRKQDAPIIRLNPVSYTHLDVYKRQEIIRLDVDEVALLLDEVEQGEKLTDKQKAYHNKTKVRDLAILTLMLGTGIRVSECVGLDLDDIDFKNGGIHIHRKGGKEVTRCV